MDLARLTKNYEDLKQVILKKREEKGWQKNEPPKWFIDQVESYIEFLCDPGDNPGSEFKLFVHEAAIKMLSGEDIWDKIRERQK